MKLTKKGHMINKGFTVSIMNAFYWFPRGITADSPIRQKLIKSPSGKHFKFWLYFVAKDSRSNL